MFGFVENKIHRFAVSNSIAKRVREEDLRGKDGYIRKDTGSLSDLFRRSVSIFYIGEWDYQRGAPGLSYNLNRGSVIDFLNAHSDDSVQYDKGWLGFIGGTDHKTLEVAFKRVRGKIVDEEKRKADEELQKQQEELDNKEKAALAEKERQKAEIERAHREEREAYEKVQKERREGKEAERAKGFYLDGDARLYHDVPNDNKGHLPFGATKKRKYAQIEGERELVVRMTGKGERAVRHMNREAEIFKTLKGCPGVVTHLGTRESRSKYGQIKKSLYLEKFDGDLRTFGLKELYALPSEQKRKIAVLLLRGLAAMHERGISHNDIKFENILIRSKAGSIEVVFCDFDLATSDMDAGGAIGTPIWNSPEKVNSCANQARKPADIWAVGLVFRTLFVDGKEPHWFGLERGVYQAMNEMAKMREREGSFYPEPEKKDSLDHIIWEMLQYDYTRRPTAKQVLKEVEALADEDFSPHRLIV